MIDEGSRKKKPLLYEAAFFSSLSAYIAAAEWIVIPSGTTLVR